MGASWLQRLPSQAEMDKYTCITLSLRSLETNDYDFEDTIQYDVSTIQWNLPYGQRTDAHNL